jgi:hypothetical protein
MEEPAAALVADVEMVDEKTTDIRTIRTCSLFAFEQSSNNAHEGGPSQ